MSTTLCYSATLEELRWCADHEIWPIIHKNEAYSRQQAQIEKEKQDALYVLKRYHEATNDTMSYAEDLYNLANDKDWEALETLLQTYQDIKEPKNKVTIAQWFDKLEKTAFTNTSEKLTINVVLNGATKAQKKELAQKITTYNPIIESWCRDDLDLLAVEVNDSLRNQMCIEFIKNWPKSEWRESALFYQFISLKRLKKYKLLEEKINIALESASPELIYQICTLWTDQSFRHSVNSSNSGNFYLYQSEIWLNKILDRLDEKENYRLLFNEYSDVYFGNKILLQLLKTEYSLFYASIGKQEDTFFIPLTKTESNEHYQRMLDLNNRIQFTNNDNGEMAEYAFWKAKTYLIPDDATILQTAIDNLIDCLTFGAPRNPYDEKAMEYLEIARNKLSIQTPLMDWIRNMEQYTGPTFEDATVKAGLDSLYTGRISIGDYDNDSYPDLLLSGSMLWHNEKGSFKNVTDTTGIHDTQAQGGLWADFNKDGKLDFVTTSSSPKGEDLYKNMDGKHFAPVGERAGDVNDGQPTEGAAWVDLRKDGYPSLYTANYETSTMKGTPDYFWQNQKGYFSDQSTKMGIHTPNYTINPACAGRGAAPADFDNDGTQEIYITNYRLCRNFLWDLQKDSILVDNAALDAVQGNYKKGYYGHSIGADWGDYDNDGDLDLFVANLAHPRYLNISDISTLYRNDGKRVIVIDDTTISYWQFTDITQEAGITYDETHSDPTWFDADNDGDLDLFISSIYPNERSYLYLNMGDGHFKDVTFLSGCRTYNGWGNAVADFDRDGKLDLCVGSGSGLKLLMNKTNNKNKSISLHVVWNQDKVIMANDTDWLPEWPNSPAFGARVRITVIDNVNRKHVFMRELSSAKGTTSQNWQLLHFGYQNWVLKKVELLWNTKVVQTWSY